MQHLCNLYMDKRTDIFVKFIAICNAILTALLSENLIL